MKKIHPRITDPQKIMAHLDSYPGSFRTLSEEQKVTARSEYARRAAKIRWQ